MFDYHVHSEFSADCTVPMRDSCEAAIAAGVTEIAFTDHVEHQHTDLGYGYYKIEEYLRSVEQVQARTDRRPRNEPGHSCQEHLFKYPKPILRRCRGCQMFRDVISRAAPEICEKRRRVRKRRRRASKEGVGPTGPEMDADGGERPFRRHGHILRPWSREHPTEVPAVVSAEDHVRGSRRQHAFAAVRRDVTIAAPEKPDKRRQRPAGSVDSKG